MSVRAGFMGSPDFAVPSLQAVARTCDLRVVVCQPDRPAGRGRKLSPPPVKEAAQRLGLAVVQPSKMKDGTLLRVLESHALEVIVVVAFGRILPPEILALPRYGCINVHASLLPRWRGAAPIQRAVLAGDQRTGVSIMAMDEGLDTGAVYERHETPIAPRETSGDVFERLAQFGAEHLEDFLRRFPNTRAPLPQSEAGACYAPMLKKEEGWVDWNRAAADVVNHIRGMDPWPGAFCWRGEHQRVKLFRASPSLEATELAPGTVAFVDERGVHVACSDGMVCVGMLQPQGGRKMSAKDYAAGHPFAAHEQFAAGAPS